MPDRTAAPRRIADRYLLDSELGRGGIGIVWRATDELLRRQVAVKEISFPKAVSPADAEALKTRVLREARAAAGINHPGVVAVYDILQSDERAFIVMELVEAPTLSDLVKDQGALEPRRAAAIGLDVLTTLEVAHERGIVHRDVKPANVMVLPDGTAKLADFGIASLQNDPRLTASGIILGSPAFMAPEQAQENTSSPATDTWGLGATLFFAVQGEPPFDKGQAIPTLTAVLSEEPQITAKAGALGPVLKAMLQKDPDKRPNPQQTQELLAGVAAGDDTGVDTKAATAVAAAPAPTRVETQAAPAATAVAARRETEPHRELPDEPRGRGLLVGLGIAALAGLIALLFFLGGDDEDPATKRGKRNAAVKGQTQEPADEDDEGEPAAPQDEATAEPTEAAEEDGLVEYVHPETGYTVSVPAGWETEPDSATATDFTSPSGAYLRVAFRTPPGEDVLGTLEAQYDDFATRYEDYEEIAIDSVEYRDYEAAQAEYTYQGQHAINLQFVTGDYGFALNFQTPEGEWEELLPTFEAIKESFEPPA